MATVSRQRFAALNVRNTFLRRSQVRICQNKLGCDNKRKKFLQKKVSVVRKEAMQQYIKNGFNSTRSNGASYSIGIY